MALGRCNSCRGFVAANSKSCPSCGAKDRNLAKALTAVGGVIAAGAVSVTLMACYGCPGADCMDTGEQYCPTSGQYVAADASCPVGDSGYDKADVSITGDADVPDGGGSDAGSIGDASTDASDFDAADADGG